jgi:hypothetical protein
MGQIIEEMANEDGVNILLKTIAEDLAVNPPEDKNKGHDALMQDLTQILYEAHHNEFHDFKNNKYAAPKMELAEQLSKLRENVINGKYDN